MTTRSLLIFDGDCGFCTSSAAFARRRLNVEVTPWQSLRLDDLGLTEGDVTTAAYWVDDTGATHRGERAIAQMLITAGLPWSLAGRTMLWPGVVQVAGVAYRWIATNRHRLPGSTDACRLDR